MALSAPSEQVCQPGHGVVTAWREVQERIWCCELCRGHERVACNIRQQTEAPTRPSKLLLIGVAPPHAKEVGAKAAADSATNNEDDNLRKLFIVATLGLSWPQLLERGLFLVHGVKCAIVPKDRHQNPPIDVVDVCAPLYFADEIRLTRPPRIVAFGGAPYRALAQVPGVRFPPNLGVSTRVAELVARTKAGVEIQIDGWTSRLHVSPFPLSGKKPNPIAADVLREAARLSGVAA